MSWQKYRSKKRFGYEVDELLYHTLYKNKMNEIYSAQDYQVYNILLKKKIDAVNIYILKKL